MQKGYLFLILFLALFIQVSAQNLPSLPSHGKQGMVATAHPLASAAALILSLEEGFSKFYS